MSRKTHRKTEDSFGAGKASALTLAFGLAVLTFLTLVDHAEWFHIRPMSGTAAAISYASEAAPAGSGFRAASARP